MNIAGMGERVRGGGPGRKRYLVQTTVRRLTGGDDFWVAESLAACRGYVTEESNREDIVTVSVFVVVVVFIVVLVVDSDIL